MTENFYTTQDGTYLSQVDEVDYLLLGINQKLYKWFESLTIDFENVTIFRIF